MKTKKKKTRRRSLRYTFKYIINVITRTLISAYHINVKYKKRVYIKKETKIAVEF